MSDGEEDDGGDTVVVVGMKRGRERADSEQHAKILAATRAALLRALPPSALSRMQAGGDAMAMSSALRQVTTTAAPPQPGVHQAPPPVYPGSLMHLRQHFDPSLRASSSSRIQPVNGAPQASQQARPPSHLDPRSMSQLQQVSQLERRTVTSSQGLSSSYASSAESRAEVNSLRPPQIPPLPFATFNPEVKNLRERLKFTDERRFLIESIIQSEFRWDTCLGE